MDSRIKLSNQLVLRHKEHLIFWTLESRETGDILKSGTYEECFDFAKELK